MNWMRMIDRAGNRRRWGVALVALAALVLVVAGARLSCRARGGAENESVGLTAEVQRGPLTISLVESGTIRNRERVIVRSEVEGTRTILQLVDEGETVEVGDLLVELDSSSLEEDRLEQEARVESREAAVIQSSESLEVARNQAEADVAQAELDLRFARMALEQYEEGEYPQQLQESEAAITISTEEVKRAQETLEWSKKLEEDGYITRSELDADALSLKRAELDLELEIGKRDLLTRYTHVQTLEKLQSDIRQAEMALERVRRRARADVIRAEADLKSQQSDLLHQKNRLEHLQDQISKCRILAPTSGMVVYATSVEVHRWRRIDPLELGQTVRERQELIHLPTTNDMMVEVSVQEASLPKIREGLPARITLDTDPDRVFSGVLERIGILPDSAGMALNPDLKMYRCSVYIDSQAAGLRQGMSCTVELLIEQYEDVLYIPLQALLRVNGEPTVYVARGESATPRSVQVGLDNGRMVHVMEGLTAGERVLLAPPLAPSVRREEPREVSESASEEDRARKTPTGESRPGPSEENPSETPQARPQRKTPRRPEASPGKSRRGRAPRPEHGDGAP